MTDELTDAERLLAATHNFLQSTTCRCWPKGYGFDTFAGQKACGENTFCPKIYQGIRSRIAQYFGNGDEALGYERLAELCEVEDRDQYREVDGGHGDQIRAVLSTGVLSVY